VVALGCRLVVVGCGLFVDAAIVFGTVTVVTINRTT